MIVIKHKVMRKVELENLQQANPVAHIKIPDGTSAIFRWEEKDYNIDQTVQTIN